MNFIQTLKGNWYWGVLVLVAVVIAFYAKFKKKN